MAGCTCRLEIRRRQAHLDGGLEDVDVAAPGIDRRAGAGPAAETLSRQVELTNLVMVALAVADPDASDHVRVGVEETLFDDDCTSDEERIDRRARGDGPRSAARERTRETLRMDFASLRIEDRDHTVLAGVDLRSGVEHSVVDAEVMPLRPPCGSAGRVGRTGHLEQPKGAGWSEIHIDRIRELDPDDSRAVGIDLPVRDSHLAPGAFPVGPGEECHLFEAGKARRNSCAALCEGRSLAPFGADHQPLLHSLPAVQCIFRAGGRCPKSRGRSRAATVEAAAPQWRYVNPDDSSELVGVRSSVMSPTLALAGHRPT